MRLYGSAPVLTILFFFSALSPSTAQAQTCSLNPTLVAVPTGPSEALGELAIDCSSSLPVATILLQFANGVEIPDPSLAVLTSNGISIPGTAAPALLNAVTFSISASLGTQLRISGLRVKTSMLTEGSTINAVVIITAGTTVIPTNNPNLQLGYVLSRVTIVGPDFSPIARSASYSKQLIAVGGTTPYTWSISSGSLPPGLSLHSTTGVISGNPSSIGTYPFSITATDASNITSVPKDFTLNVSSQSIIPLCFATGTNVGMIAAGTTEILGDLYLNCSPTLPPTGSVSIKLFARIPGETAANIVPVEIPYPELALAEAGAANPGSRESSDTARFPITSPSSTLRIHGILADATKIFTEGATAQVFAEVSLKDSTSVTLYSDSRVVGTPIPFDVAVITNTSPLPTGTKDVAYPPLTIVTNRTGPFNNFIVVAGSLPPGLSLNSDSGIISGTPTTIGEFRFAISANEAIGFPYRTQTKLFSLAITATSIPSIITSTLPDGMVGTSYAQALTVTGGTAPYTQWQLTSGSLPPGLTLQTNGTITGIPSQAGIYALSIVVRDALGILSSPRVLILTVRAIPPVLITTNMILTGATKNVTTSYQLEATGGQAPYSWAIASGNLPIGVTLNPANGVISGAPTQTGTFTFTATVRDTRGTTASQSFTMDVAGLRITTPPTLPTGGLGNTYTISLSAAGGSNLFQWELASGSLPPGLTLFSNGTITGSPLFSGTTTFSVRATEITAQGNNQRTMLAVTPPESAVQTFTLSIPASVVITTSSLRDGTASASYSSKLEARGGTGSLNWTIVDGSLPVGMSLSQSGELLGTPTTAGTYQFRINAKDTNGVSDTESFTLKVVNGFTRAGVLSQIASGGSWKTSVTLVNPSSFPVNVKINFLGNDGTPLALPFTGITEPTSVIERTIDARSTLLLETASNSSSTVAGWADIYSSGEVTGYAIFRQQTPDGIVAEGTVPLERTPTQSFVLPFDNTAGFGTGVALATTSEANNNSVTATIRDDQGASLGNYAVLLSARGHSSFMLSDQFGVTAGKRGSVEFKLAGNAGISGIGLRFASNSSFTSIPVAKPTQAGVFSQIASGGVWKTSLNLLNPHSVPVTVKVSFQSQNGAPWALPLSISLASSTTNSVSSTIEETLTPHQTLLIETEAPNTATAAGWANVKASSPLTGFAIFRQKGNGQDSEGTTPLESLAQSSFILPFINKTDIATGLALVSPIEGRASTIKATFWDERGTALNPETITLPAQGHTSFMMNDKFLSTQGKSGFVLFEAPADLSVTGIGLRFSSSGTFTSIPTAQK